MVESLAAGGGGQAVAARGKVRGERAVGGEEPLRVVRTLALAHALLVFPRGLVGTLGAIVQSLVPPMREARQHVAQGHAVAGRLVGNHRARYMDGFCE